MCYYFIKLYLKSYLEVILSNFNSAIFYSYGIISNNKNKGTDLQFIYITLVNNMDGYGLSNKACHEYHPEKTKVTLYLVIHFIIGGMYTSSKTEQFSHVDDWVYTYIYSNTFKKLA